MMIRFPQYLTHGLRAWTEARSSIVGGHEELRKPSCGDVMDALDDLYMASQGLRARKPCGEISPAREV